MKNKKQFIRIRRRQGYGGQGLRRLTQICAIGLGLSTLISQFSTTCQAQQNIYHGKLQGDLNGGGNSITNAGTVSATNLVGNLSGTNLIPGTVSSNAFDAPTKAMLGGGGGNPAAAVTNQFNEFTGPSNKFDGPIYGSLIGNSSSATHLASGDTVTNLTVTNLTATGANLTGNINPTNKVSAATNADNATTAGMATTASNLIGGGSVIQPLNFTNFTTTTNWDMQGWLNSLPTVANDASGVGGGTIKLPAGIFLISTNSLFVSAPFHLEVDGAGRGLTWLVVTNMNGTTPGMSYGSTSGNFMSATFKDFNVVSMNDVTNSILFLYQLSDGQLDNVFFSYWQYATNAHGEFGGGYGMSATNLVGFNIRSIAGQIGANLHNVAVGGLLDGGEFAADHVRIDGYFGIEDCGMNSTFSGGTSSGWGTNIESLGGGLLFNNSDPLNIPIGDILIHGMHSYHCARPIIRNCPDNPGTFGQFTVEAGDFGEGGGARSATVYTNSFAMVFNFNNQGQSSVFNGFPERDQTLIFTGSAWNLLTNPPPNVVEERMGTNNAIIFSIADVDTLIVSNKAVIALAPVIAPSFAVGGTNLTLILTNYQSLSIAAPNTNLYYFTTTGGTQLFGTTNGNLGGFAYDSLINQYTNGYIYIYLDTGLGYIVATNSFYPVNTSPLANCSVTGASNKTNWLSTAWRNSSSMTVSGVSPTWGTNTVPKIFSTNNLPGGLAQVSIGNSGSQTNIFHTNTAPTTVTIGVTAPDLWENAYDINGNPVGWMPVWTNH
jgi:hypothetical protein